ncbi:MAG: efflux RND transporter periplasmic adaptor subunit [Desulfomonilaceae bacterium]|nr:efflux RND transporter periplasmic adaptor subunit [Desulfomonilaceae bacterium]
MEESRLHVLKSAAEERPMSEADGAVPRPRFNWKTRVLAPGLVLGGFALLLGVSAYEELVPPLTVHASPVVLKSAQSTVSGAVTVQAAGWVEADPYKSYVTALTDGIVNQVLVLEGEQVKQGQVAARLVDEDARLAARRAQDKVKELEAVLAAERAELAAAETEWKNPVERTRAVAVAKARVAESKATLKQIASEIAVEESNLEHSKSQYDRGVALRSSGSVSEQEFIRLRSQYNAQTSKIAALRMRGAAETELMARHQADLSAAEEHMTLRTEERRKLDRARAATLQAEAALSQARTALAEADLRLERTEIRSPMDGIVMGRLTEPGSKVVVLSDNPGSARVLSLYDPARLQVRVDVPLSDAAKVSVGQQAEVTVEVLPDRHFSGTVTRVLHEANIQKNTLEVKVAVADPDPRLRPEMLARVKLLARPSPDADTHTHRVFAPENAIRGTGSNATAWTVRIVDRDRGIVLPVPVKLGTGKTDGWVDVLDGLQPGDLVVTSSVAELSNGKKVKVVTD